MDFLAGNRIRGTTAEKATLVPAITGTGGWKEVARTTLGTATTEIDVSSIPDKRYYMTLLSSVGLSQAATSRFRYNGDTGNTKAYRQSSDGTTDALDDTINGINIKSGGNTELPWFNVGYHANLSAKEKLMISHTVAQTAAGAGNAPSRDEIVGKQVLTSSINQITSFLASSGSYSSGAEMVVLGWDEDDTHGSNFWEELASTTLTSAGDNLSSGTISAKKYLWFQAYIIPTGGSANCNLTFNNDTSSNYSLRYTEGTNEQTLTGESLISMDVAKKSTPFFINGFVINNSANEKLSIIHQMNQDSTGAGNAPTRNEIVGKWANTSAQITEIDIDNPQVGVDYNTGSMLKVWGSN